MKADKQENNFLTLAQDIMHGGSDEIAERLFHGAEKIASVISEVVFPHQLYCVCCGNIIDSTRSYSLCDHCMEHIRWNVDEPRNIDGMRVMRCADYGIYERSIIFAFKYDGHKYIARDIARIMADRLRIEGFKSSDENMLIVPVPLHENKYLVRGFNQSKLIGKYLAKEMDLKLSDVLLRVHETKALRGLGAAERAETIAGSMELIKDNIDLVQDKDIMLVDDFFTTGSTARECRRALEKGKPKSVSLIAFAGREWREAIKLSEEVI